MTPALLLASLLMLAESDTTGPHQPSGFHPGKLCMTDAEMAALDTMRIEVSEHVRGTDYFVAWVDCESTLLARSSVPRVKYVPQAFVAGSHVEVTAAVVAEDQTHFPPVLTRWSTTLGRGELPLAIEWLLLRWRFAGNVELRTRKELLFGLQTGDIGEGYGGYTVILAAAAAKDARVEDGPDDQLKTLRFALAALEKDPAAAARQFDGLARTAEMPDVVRSFHVEALSMATRCAEARSLTETLATRGLGDPARARSCEEGFCLLYSGNVERLADWAHAHAADPPTAGDCAPRLWAMSIDELVRNPRTSTPGRDRAFIELQRTRLAGFAADPRFDGCRERLAEWDQREVSSRR